MIGDTKRTIEKIKTVFSGKPVQGLFAATSKGSAEVEMTTDELKSLAFAAERYREMLAEVIDANYGTASHHIGDGDGMDEGRAEEIRGFWEEYIAEKHAG